MARRRVAWTVGVILIALLAITARAIVRDTQEKAETQKRNAAAIQATLFTYLNDLKPGATRKDVEEYLRLRHTAFTQNCCYEEPITAAILVKAGEEVPPWYCSEWPVYAVFEFVVSELDIPLPDYDVQKKIHLESNGIGYCL